MQIPHRLVVTESSRNRIWQIKQRTWNDPEAAVRLQTCGGPLIHDAMYRPHPPVLIPKPAAVCMDLLLDGIKFLNTD